MKSKSIWCLFIVLILFNFIFVNFSYADDEDLEDGSFEYTKENVDDLLDNGQTDLGEVSSSTSQAAGATGLVASIGSVIIVPLKFISDFVNEGGIYRTESDYSPEDVGWLNIGSLVFDEYFLFNINLSATTESLNPDIEPTTIENAIDSIKSASLGIYGIVNTFCIVIIFVLIIYTFIRSFLSKNPTDKAKYKEIGNAWVRAIIFIFLALFIIMFINVLLEWLMDILYNLRISMENAGYASFENILFAQAADGLADYSGFTAMMYLLELLLFVVIDLWFFGKYIVRSFMIFLLTMLAPIYAVMDVYRRLNNRSGMLNKWFNSYLSYVFIQPLHAVMYLVFMLVGANLVLRAPLAGIILIYALLMAERVGRVMFDFSKDTVGSLFSRA